MDCGKIGWAVQRLGAGRERGGQAVTAHAGLEMLAKLGTRVEAGQPLCEIFADDEALFAEPERLLAEAITIDEKPAETPDLVGEIITVENKNQYLESPPHP
jgi:pyrimidine-nucleoside phosphorylase